MSDKQICQDAPCTCDALPGQDYCCDACLAAAERQDPNETRCHCGHEDCGGEPVVPVETSSMLLASAALAES